MLSKMFKNTFLASVTKPFQIQKRFERNEDEIKVYSAGRPLKHQISAIKGSRYGGRFLVTMIIGGGIGKELMDYVSDVFRYAQVPIDFDKVHVHGVPEMQDAIMSLKRNGTALLSNMEDALADALTTMDNSPNVIFRQIFDLHLNLVRFKTFDPLPNLKFRNMDIVVIRQNTEGEYAMLEHENVKGVVESMKIITRHNSNRIATSAFDYAVRHNRKKVTVVTKANIMKLTDGLFLEECLAVSKKYPNIETETILIDNCCMQLVKSLEQFDIVVMPNLYGSVISNLLSGLLGGPGLYSGNNYGPDFAVFETAARSLGKEIVGKNIANPTAILSAAVALLYHLHLDYHADLIEKSIRKTLCEDKIWTRDLGGTHNSTDIVDKVKQNIRSFKPKMF